MNTNCKNKILSYVMTALFWLFFAPTMILLHPIHWIVFHIFGYKTHKVTLNFASWITLLYLRIFLGTQIKVIQKNELPKNVPILIVSNHQSLWEIPFFDWYFRKIHPKFVTKESLRRGVPSISFNLRVGGSVFLRRNDKEHDIKVLNRFADRLKEKHYSGVFFPEGTWEKQNKTLPFKPAGLLKMLEKLNSEGYVIPVTIHNFWKLLRWNFYPIQYGVKATVNIHRPIKISDYPTNKLFDIIERIITGDLENHK